MDMERGKQLPMMLLGATAKLLVMRVGVTLQRELKAVTSTDRLKQVEALASVAHMICRHACSCRTCSAKVVLLQQG